MTKICTHNAIRVAHDTYGANNLTALLLLLLLQVCRLMLEGMGLQMVSFELCLNV